MKKFTTVSVQVHINEHLLKPLLRNAMVASSNYVSTPNIIAPKVWPNLPDFGLYMSSEIAKV